MYNLIYLIYKRRFFSLTLVKGSKKGFKESSSEWFETNLYESPGQIDSKYIKIIEFDLFFK